MRAIIMSLALLFFLLPPPAGAEEAAEAEALPLAVPGLAPEPAGKLTAEMLDTSIELLRQHLVLNQTRRGDFVYSYNIESREPGAETHTVRQAGALWGLSLAHRYGPSLLTEKALRSGFAYFAANSSSTVGEGRFIAVEGDRIGKTGVIALMLLAHLETIAAEGNLTAVEKEMYREYARQYLTFLMRLRREDGHFHGYYTYANNGTPRGIPSPYFDGEALLALVRTARVMELDALKPIVIESASAMLRTHVIQALSRPDGGDDIKAFFHWGALAILEMHGAGWDADRNFTKAAVVMAKYMIYKHRILERTANTAYAYEGLIAVSELARRSGDTETVELLRPVIEQGLYELISWQVGGPRENAYLARLKVRDPLAVGGILQRPDEPWLRIDVAQHQLHALLMARRFLFAD